MSFICSLTRAISSDRISRYCCKNQPIIAPINANASLSNTGNFPSVRLDYGPSLFDVGLYHFFKKLQVRLMTANFEVSQQIGLRKRSSPDQATKGLLQKRRAERPYTVDVYNQSLIGALLNGSAQCWHKHLFAKPLTIKRAIVRHSTGGIRAEFGSYVDHILSHDLMSESWTDHSTRVPPIECDKDPELRRLPCVVCRHHPPLL